jgi:hypothetical protein
MPTDLKTEIARPTAKIDNIASRVAKHTELLPEVFAGLIGERARLKYGSLKVLRVISEKAPMALYPEFDRFAAMLDDENVILRWGASIIIGNLAAVDSQDKIDRLLDRFLRPISGHNMITAANIIGASAKIARAKPHLADKIVRALLEVEDAIYQTPECRNVALGHTVQTLSSFFDLIDDPKPVIALVKRQRENTRNAVRRKAAAFLRKHGRGGVCQFSVFSVQQEKPPAGQTSPNLKTEN